MDAKTKELLEAAKLTLERVSVYSCTFHDRRERLAAAVRDFEAPEATDKSEERLSFEDVENILYDLYDEKSQEWTLSLKTASECCWSAELKVIPEPNSNGPDVGHVHYSTGHADPLTATIEVLESAQRQEKMVR